MASLAQERESEEKEQRAKQREAQLDRIRNSVLAEAEEERREIGFNSRLLIQATMPHSKPPKGTYEWERTNGYVTLHIQAPSEYGLPYGTYPRLLLAWVTTEAVRAQSPKLVLGGSLREFLSKIGVSVGGPQARRVRKHMQRLFKSTVSATYQQEGKWVERGFRPVEGSNIFWDPRHPDQLVLWDSSIELNQKFFEEVISHPVPIDLATLRALSRSPMAIDAYQWLTYRMSYLTKKTLIPWDRLHLQFGAEYARTRDFKRKFRLCLKSVLEQYPDVKIESEPGGLLLKPSAPHVPMKLAAKGS